MKIKLLSTLSLSIVLLASCGEAESTENTTDAPNTDTVVELVEESTEEVKGSNTVTDEQMAHYEELLDLTSTETAGSDCFITESFTYMDGRYITVDFVNYKMDESTANTDTEVYELVNEIKTLRTFVVKEEYYDCGHSEMVKLSDLIEKNKAEKDLVFKLEVEDGVVTELYIDTCSG